MHGEFVSTKKIKNKKSAEKLYTERSLPGALEVIRSNKSETIEHIILHCYVFKALDRRSGLLPLCKCRGKDTHFPGELFLHSTLRFIRRKK